MSTLEKLFVQIFERRNRILEQVQQQTDLLKQNLATKALIEGIDPPPWLWNPSNYSSDVPKVLNKEELISELFLPRPQPSVSFSDSRYYLCNQSAVQERGEISDGSFKVAHACRNGGSRDEQSHAACVEENNAECGINAVTEEEVSVTSPEEETEPRISEVYATQEQSLFRIQRSKSRQKALEMRTSANAKRKSLMQESALVGSSLQDRSSLFGNKTVDLVNGMGNMAESFVVSHESGEVNELNKSDGWKKEIEIVVPSGEFRNARNSVAVTTRALDGLKGGCSNYENCTQQQCSKDISRCQGSGNKLMEDVGTFNVTIDSRGACEERAGDEGGDRGNDSSTCGGRILTSSSSQRPRSLNELLNHNKLSHAMESEEGVIPKSGGCLAQLFKDAIESTLVNTLAEPSSAVALEMTNLKTSLCNHGLTSLPFDSSLGPRERRSESGESFAKMNENHSTFIVEAEMPCAGSNMVDHGLTTLSYNSGFGPRERRSESGESFAKMHENHSTFIGEAEIPCAGSNMVNRAEFKFAAVNRDEHMPISSVKDLTSNSCLPLESARLECLAKTSFGCLRSVDPKQLNFDDTAGCNFNGMYCITMQSERRESPAKEVFVESSDPQVFCCNPTAQGSMLLEEQKTFQESEHLVGSSGSALEEHAKDHLKEYSFSGNFHTTTKAGQDNSEVLHVQSATPAHQANNKPVAFQTFSTANQSDFFSEEGFKFTPELQNEYHGTAEGKEKSASIPHALEREHSKSDYHAEKDDLSVLRSVGFATGDDKDLDPLKSVEIQYPQKLHSVKGYSWHQNKRRKIEDQETSAFSASPSFRIRTEQIKAINLSMNLGGEKETVLEESAPVMYHIDGNIYPKVSRQLTKTTDASVETISYEGSLYSEVLAENENMTPSPNLNQEDSVLFSFKDIGGLSQGCSLNKVDLAGGSYNVREDQKNGPEFEAFIRTEDLIDTESTVFNGYYFNADSGLSGDLAKSSAKIDLETIGADQTMPALEGFIMDSETLNEKMDIPGSENIFDELELTRTSIERASILEQICKSASKQTPFTQMSSSFQLQRMDTCHLSLPNGLIEGTNMKGFSTLDGNVYDCIRSRCVDETKEIFHAMTYPDCLPNSKCRYAWDLRNPFTFASPVGKLWEKSSLHSDSSEKRLSSNPDLRCFPIEEDPDNSEESDDISLPDRVEENIDTGVYTCAERQPLAAISAVYPNGTSPVPVAEKCANKCSSNPVATDFSVKRTSNKFKRKVGKLSKSRSDEKKNDILLTGANRMNKSGYSLNNSNCKKRSSYATGSRTQQRKLLGKENKRNNIVSNVTSFIPMVQKEQAAALSKAAGGKRDIKVKALEVAEAAKRQQEKRDQERKLRKEAMQQERARVERENSRLMKLNKKKNEEQRKKKDAEIVAKKREREEEERKEKERKRKRTEEAKSQRLEEGKFVGDKVDKEQRFPLLDGDDKKKDANNGFQKRKDLSMESKDHVTFEKHATKLAVNGPTSDVQHASLSLGVCGTSGDSLHDMKVTPAITKYGDANNLIQKVQEKSYEISPYQNSDEEDDNNDDYYVPREKYIPPWASESCLALALRLQKDIKPDKFFPPDSFCSTSEIVVRRR